MSMGEYKQWNFDSLSVNAPIGHRAKTWRTLAGKHAPACRTSLRPAYFSRTNPESITGVY
jgi:hypothetical protein